MSDVYVHLEGLGWLPIQELRLSIDGHDPCENDASSAEADKGSDRDYFHVRVDEFEIRPRPRLEGDDRRRPDVARTSFQSAVMRSFVEKPDQPLDLAYVKAQVPGDVGLPAAGTLKAIIDATVDARIVKNDRSAIVGASLLKYDRWGMRDSTTDIEVMPAIAEGDGDTQSFAAVRSRDRRTFASAVADPVAYADRSGVPGEVRFSNPWVTDPRDYEAQLLEKWHDLLDKNRILIEPDDWSALFLSGALTVYLPKKCSEDGDNALLYVVDMLEVARREILGEDAGDLTLDELLVEVRFRRALETGIWIWLSPIDRVPQFDFVRYMGDEPWREPFDPDAL